AVLRAAACMLALQQATADTVPASPIPAAQSVHANFKIVTMTETAEKLMYLNAGTPVSIDLPPFKASRPYRYRGPEQLTFYRTDTGTDTAADALVPAASVRLLPNQKDVL